uniref:Uncharacterized protein n=1 Tax=Pectobacterium atrosepticum TaxID=29471 RepID=B8X8Z2_PECAT|nr:hypothetical protein [Pectobacterium atrosepticum]
MALSAADISRLKSLTSLVAGVDRKLLQLQSESNREVNNRNKYVQEMNRIHAKR